MRLDCKFEVELVRISGQQTIGRSRRFFSFLQLRFEHFLLSFVLVVFGSCAVLAEERVALVIGNSDYAYVSPLDNPKNDAVDISLALEGLGFEVLLSMDQSRSDLRENIEAFGELAENADVVLLYYAGHGFQVNGTNFLLPVDAQLGGIQDLDEEALPLSDILRVIDGSNGLKLIFLDACRDNPFGAELDGLPNVSGGLARVGTDADYMFVYATQPDNVAYDGMGRNSFFTEAVLSHIYSPGQDIQQMMINVRRDVIAVTGGRQIPWENSSLTQQFQFVRSAVTASEETLLWQVAANEGDAQLLQLYMERYPEGAHVQDVLAFLEDDSRIRALQLKDETAEAQRIWNLARRTRMRPLLEFYVKNYPDGRNVAEARRLLEVIPDVQDTSPGSVCERLATHPRDATAAQQGVSFERLQKNSLPAIQACAAAATQSPELPHYTALLARATAASGDLERAVSLYKSAADRGDLRAMVSLAQLAETGNGVPQDFGAALDLYERAAAAGSIDGMINLAVILFQGGLVAQDTERAISLLRQAAELGSPKAIFNLGVLAQDGLTDTPADALDYFIDAARDGELGGFRAAAILLDEGRGVERDAVRAADLLLRGVAADRGDLLQHLMNSTDQWSRDTIRALQSRLQEAGYYTASIDGLAGPGFSAALTRWRNGGFREDILSEI